MLRFPKSHASAWKRTLTNLATRAIVYESNGNPASVLSAVTCPPLPKPTGSSITVKHILSPVHPADINAVEGVYPYQPRARQLDVDGRKRALHIPGNEGLGEVTDVGEGVKGLKKGDWVVFGKNQSGTWSSGQILEEGDVIKVDRETGISAVNAATLVVGSSPTSVSDRLLIPGPRRRIQLQHTTCYPISWICNQVTGLSRTAPTARYDSPSRQSLVETQLSQVGQAVISLAKLRGLNTINFIRKRSVLRPLI